MYINWTQEKCTGTGEVLTLTGATAGNLKFSDSLVDGELVEYSILDSAAVIKIVGVGVYSLNTITRNDKTTWDGSVLNKNPTPFGLTLSSGEHTISCDVTKTSLVKTRSIRNRYNINASGVGTPDNWNGSTVTNNAPAANECKYLGIRIDREVLISSLVINVTAASGTLSIAGIYSVGIDSKPDRLLMSATIDTTTTGIKSAPIGTPVVLEPGDYYSAFASNGTPTIRTGTTSSFSTTSYNNTFNVPRNYHPKETLVSGWLALPSAPNPNAIDNYPAIVGWL